MNLEVANSIIEGAFAAAARESVAPLAVVVLDDSGNIVSAQRQDGSSMFRVDIALGKAWGAAALGVSSREIGRRAKDNPNFFGALAATSRGRILPQPGAVVVVALNGQVVGSVGASGGTGDQDEACCASGVVSSGLLVGEG